MTKLEIMRSARKLLSDPRRWTKGHFATINPETREPCYCALGAIRAACGYNDIYDGASRGSGFIEGDYDLYTEVTRELGRTISGTYRTAWVPGWNDKIATTYEDVMEAFSKTCERLYDEEQEVAVAS